MEVLNLIRLFWGWVFPYISLTYSLYRFLYLHFRYLKCLVIFSFAQIKPPPKSIQKNLHPPGGPFCLSVVSTKVLGVSAPLGGEEPPFEKDGIFGAVTLPEGNMAPENGWLED